MSTLVFSIYHSSVSSVSPVISDPNPHIPRLTNGNQKPEAEEDQQHQHVTDLGQECNFTTLFIAKK
jgi:hypothetical protein